MLSYLKCRELGLLAAAGAAMLIPALAASPAVKASTDIVAAAKLEGKVVVYSVLSTNAAQPLIEDFQSLYPGISMEYDGDKGSNEMDARYRSELAAGQPTADVVWSSATDMQMKLVQEGYAASYRSPEAAKLPQWAVYRDLAYGVTLEPVAIVYNRQLVTGKDIPKDRYSLTQLLNEQRKRFAGKITGFDIEKSGVGFMFAAQDRRAYKQLDKMLAQFGAARFTPLSGTGDMLKNIDSGNFLLGYNMMGSYALSRSKKDLPNLGVVFPADYTLAFPRVAFVSKHAAHPNAARLWLDYLLSARGQKLLSEALQLFPVRSDTGTKKNAATLEERLGTSIRPVPLTMELVKDLQPDRKAKLLEAWNKAMTKGSLNIARKDQ